jgi:hypothetical protein
MCEYRFKQVEKVVEIYEKVSTATINPKELSYILDDPQRLKERVARHILVKKEILDSNDLSSDIKTIFLEELEKSLALISKILSYEKMGDEKALLAGLVGFGAGTVFGAYTKGKIDEFVESTFDKVSKKTIEEMMKQT